MRLAKNVQKAYSVAKAAKKRAYAPYSHFQVGAALKVKGQEQLILGCNVENASFGATVCAERVALLSARATVGEFEPEFLIVLTDEVEATVPCALCLQVLAEFAPDNLPIYLANSKKVLKRLELKDLLPHPFRSFVVGKKKRS